MPLIMKKLAPVVLLVVLPLGSVAMAGYTYSGAHCYANWDGSGNCSGTFLGFRLSPQDNAYAYFHQTSGGSRSFNAKYLPAGATTYSTYSCVPNATVSAMWDRAMSATGYFSIAWDSSGACAELSLANGSAYFNF